jgi:tRNA-dihydrouridine synthase B
MIPLSSPFVMAPMAGMTDSAFRRLVKRKGGCGLVVTEMVSSEGLVRGIDRTLEYAEFTEEERPVSVQVFGGDPAKMARAAQVVEQLGADAVDVNMGCPVPKVAKGNAGCRLMREPAHAAEIVRAMARAVAIPVTVKMRAGWNDREVNAPELARRVEDAGAAAIAVHGRTAAQSYGGSADWELIGRVAQAVRVPVFGNGDCVEPSDLVARWRQSGVAGVLVGRGVLRNPWIFAQADALGRGLEPPVVTLGDRGRFLLEYIDLLLDERVNEAAGFRHSCGASLPGRRSQGEGARAGAGSVGQASLGAEASAKAASLPAVSERWVINKLRALCAWYTRGLEGGSRLRAAVNQTTSIPALRETIGQFFF